MSVPTINEYIETLPKRNVSIRRDGEDFVVVLAVHGVVAFRNRDANALRKICRWLRYAIICDEALTDASAQALLISSRQREALAA